MALMDLRAKWLSKDIRDVEDAWDMTESEDLSRNSFLNLVVGNGIVLFL